jgi:hypothetical protein
VIEGPMGQVADRRPHDRERPSVGPAAASSSTDLVLTIRSSPAAGPRPAGCRLTRTGSAAASRPST